MKLYQVDAFTKNIFNGNPAGVCILNESNQIDDRLFQNIALEMNLSETAFLYKENNEYTLRWFTPETEVDFCGHATLSAAHILWERDIESPVKEIEFNTKSGRLSAKKIDDRIELNFPIFEVDEIEHDPRINKSLAVTPVFTGTNSKRYLIEVHDYSELISIQPDFQLLKEFGKTAFIVTCQSHDRDYDFYSRFFAPGVGINEDPVTGSAHSYLAPYWAKKITKRILHAYQASKRGGEIECELTDNDRVLLRGNAVTVCEIKMKIGIKG